MNNVGRALVKKRCSCLVQKTSTQSTIQIFMTRFKDLYLSEKEREEKLLQCIQSTNGLKTCLGAKKADGMALTVTTQDNEIKKTFDKRFAISLDFDFFKHLVYPHGLKEDLIVRFELNSSEKVILCTGDTSAT